MNNVFDPRLPPCAFASQSPFDAKGFKAAAIYCSDGRFADQVNDFLHQGLGLAGYDRLAIAGGPACFAGHFEAYREEEEARFRTCGFSFDCTSSIG